jgi:hypothetical protein
VLEPWYRACAHLLALSAILLTATSAPAQAASWPRVTVIADSVGGGLGWDGVSNRILGTGLDLRVDSVTCRRLVAPGCGDATPTPESALAAVQRLGTALGQVVVIEVGYNDSPADVAAAIDPMMQALLAAGVQHVIWPTYVERVSEWTDSNVALTAAASRWPQLTVPDWNAVAIHHDEWFVDYAHMNTTGLRAFAAFLRPAVVTACGAACAPRFCGLARTVNGFDYVQATALGCPSALAATPRIERGIRPGWTCARRIGGDVELRCTAGDERIDLLERSPVAARRSGATVTLANWSFRLRGAEIEARSTGAWQALGGPPWCVPDAPREVLVAFRLRPITPNGGCFRPTAHG